MTTFYMTAADLFVILIEILSAFRGLLQGFHIQMLMKFELIIKFSKRINDNMAW